MDKTSEIMTQAEAYAKARARFEKRLKAAGKKPVGLCPDAATCGVSSRELMERGAGFCARCSRLRYADLWVEKPAKEE